MQVKDFILTDIDGVCLDWRTSFFHWLHTKKSMSPIDSTTHNYSVAETFGINKDIASQLVCEFNDSAAIGYLDALLDSRHYIRLLNEKHGYKFIAITSLSLDPFAKKAREQNLERLFGDAFMYVMCLDTAAPKDTVLTQMQENHYGAWWIEDKIENADVGLELGYRSILMEQDWNKRYTGSALRAKNWEDVYQAIMFDVKVSAC